MDFGFDEAVVHEYFLLLFIDKVPHVKFLDLKVFYLDLEVQKRNIKLIHQLFFYTSQIRVGDFGFYWDQVLVHADDIIVFRMVVSR